MVLTRDVQETVAARVQGGPAFARALLDEAITLFVNGQPESAKLILRDLDNAPVEFDGDTHRICRNCAIWSATFDPSGCMSEDRPRL